MKINSYPNKRFVGVNGHSLGGAIAQTQVIYFSGASQASVTVSPTKNFEPYGICWNLHDKSGQHADH